VPMPSSIGPGAASASIAPPKKSAKELAPNERANEEHVAFMNW